VVGAQQLRQTNLLGRLPIPNYRQGESTNAYVPLRDASGNLATVTFNRVHQYTSVNPAVDVPASPDVNVNFLMLAPALTAKGPSWHKVIVAFQTVTNFNYQSNIRPTADPAWILLGTLGGNNGFQSVRTRSRAPLDSIVCKFNSLGKSII